MQYRCKDTAKLSFGYVGWVLEPPGTNTHIVQLLSYLCTWSIGKGVKHQKPGGVYFQCFT